MFWIQVIAALGVVLATVMVASGRGDSLGGLPTRTPPGLPGDRAVEPADVVDLRLGIAFRGYRMDDVDEALDRLADEISSRDAEIGELRRQLGGVPDPGLPPVDGAEPLARADHDSGPERSVGG